MSAVEKRSPRPKVYATRAAGDQAARLGVEGCLEVVVANKILAGLKRTRCEGLRPPLASDERVVHLGCGLIARLKRMASPLNGEKAWRVVCVKRAPQPRGGTSP